MAEQRADVAIIMGSQSDWATMSHAAETLKALDISHSPLIVSAHRTPERLYDFAKGARDAGFRVIIAGAGGAAHLPGMTAALTPLPVFGVPVESKALSGRDSLLSIVQMPAGIPVGTLAIGRAGAVNAALLAAAVLALSDPALGRTAGRMARRHRQAAWRNGRQASHDISPDDQASRAGLRDRHRRRRPARPHDRGGRGAPRHAHHHPRPPGRLPGLPARQRPDRRRL